MRIFSLFTLKIGHLIVFYLVMIVAGAMAYSLLSKEFVINPEILLAEEKEKVKQEELLTGLIEDTYKRKGINVEIETPDDWIIHHDTIYAGYIVVSATNENVKGELLFWKKKDDETITYIQPSYATPGTEITELKFNLSQLLNIRTRGYHTEKISFFTSVYHSFATITTLGSSDIKPKSDLARAIIMFQVITGLVIFGLLINILSVKLVRIMKNNPPMNTDE